MTYLSKNLQSIEENIRKITLKDISNRLDNTTCEFYNEFAVTLVKILPLKASLRRSVVERLRYETSVIGGLGYCVQKPSDPSKL